MGGSRVPDLLLRQLTGLELYTGAIVCMTSIISECHFVKGLSENMLRVCAWEEMLPHQENYVRLPDSAFPRKAPLLTDLTVLTDQFESTLTEVEFFQEDTRVYESCIKVSFHHWEEGDWLSLVIDGSTKSCYISIPKRTAVTELSFLIHCSSTLSLSIVHQRAKNTARLLMQQNENFDMRLQAVCQD